jgi:hypothetical protein
VGIAVGAGEDGMTVVGDAEAISDRMLPIRSTASSSQLYVMKNYGTYRHDLKKEYLQKDVPKMLKNTRPKIAIGLSTTRAYIQY